MWQFRIQTLLAVTLLIALAAAISRWVGEFYFPIVFGLMIMQILLVTGWFLVALLMSPQKDGHLDLGANVALKNVVKIWLISVLVLLAMLAIPLIAPETLWRR